MNIENVIQWLDQIKTIHKDIILTNNYRKISDTVISWDNYKPGIYKNLYSKEYEHLIKNRQYSFLLKDNLGFIQFYYEYKEKEISKVKMAYYPYPVVLNEDGNDLEQYIDEAQDGAYDETLLEYYYDIWEIFNHEFELDINDEELKTIFDKSKKLGNNESIENLLLARFDFKYKHTNSSHIRVDYDSEVNSHNKCEVQIGAINQIRFPIDKIISPIIFFDFIIKNILRGEKYYEDLKIKGSYKTVFDFHRSLNNAIPSFIEDNIHLR